MFASKKRRPLKQVSASLAVVLMGHVLRSRLRHGTKEKEVMEENYRRRMCHSIRAIVSHYAEGKKK
jgi:hypothetical protein